MSQRELRKSPNSYCIYHPKDGTLKRICEVGTYIQKSKGSMWDSELLEYYKVLSEFCKSCPQTINEVYHHHDVDGDLMSLVEELKELLVIVKGIDLFQ